MNEWHVPKGFSTVEFLHLTAGVISSVLGFVHLLPHVKYPKLGNSNWDKTVSAALWLHAHWKCVLWGRFIESPTRRVINSFL